MKKLIRFTALLLIISTVLCSCSFGHGKKDEDFAVGFAEQALEYGDMGSYYIAGYKNGTHPEGVLDAQKVKGVWIDNGESSLLMIVVDCIGLDGGVVDEIRDRLKTFSLKSGCDSVNVISTHTHAGVDTLGLWGPVGVDGKNEDFSKQIISAAVSVAQSAYDDRCEGDIFFSRTGTHGLQSDTREPVSYDDGIYQLRFVPNDGSSGVRIVSFAAHAESLGSENNMISADFPGEVARIVKESSGDDMVFLPGAIGGLIKTPDFIKNDAVHNMKFTAESISRYVLKPYNEEKISTDIDIARVTFKTKLDNTLFIYYKFLGILGNNVSRTPLGDYMLETELSLIRIGNVTFSLFPGEIFPELIEKGLGKPEDGAELLGMARSCGIEHFISVGLANDEIGYIVPPSDFVLDEKAPYVVAPSGHYEETNSVGENCITDLRWAFETALRKLNK